MNALLLVTIISVCHSHTIKIFFIYFEDYQSHNLTIVFPIVNTTITAVTIRPAPNAEIPIIIPSSRASKAILVLQISIY
ncbi:hypothetical protein [Porphyromonas circumdentaria]|uniref:hypothetical protein n=1 Tax=Porphyromonas circumdentaria TaxID=29524 RepID=UPI0026DC4D3C|nr:hypothetical protein [Porphyromonas circumdentaria]MDO4722326.1 hypothetical protein [Porphyromonas circumdentaria]